MDKSDEILIAQNIDNDLELKKYVEEHSYYERILEDFNKRVYLTPEEEMEKKTIQKKKLFGKDKIHEILAKYRVG